MDVTGFQKLLNFALRKDVSDIHLREGYPPCLRIRGSLKKIQAEVLTAADMKLISGILFTSDDALKRYDALKEYDCSYQYGDICRLRVNYLKFQNKSALILRIIHMEIPTLGKLGLPKAIFKMTEIRRGMILITGVTGSGKSTTMAAMLEQINNTRDEHILTIEDPIEFLFTSKMCSITQREVGYDTESFQTALRGALRQDPDIIVIGELRDADTIQTAIKAAETGHLVFATVHTKDAQSTINRIISMFPPEEQNNVKIRLADCLSGVISQRLLPSLDGEGRVCAQEIMINTLGVKEAILGKMPLDSMYVSIENGFGTKRSQSFDQHLTELYLGKKISYEVARDAASSPTNFERNIEFGAKAQAARQAGLRDSLEDDKEGEMEELSIETIKSGLTLQGSRKTKA